MRRIVWVALGAVGGILAYRRAEQAMADAKERGVVLSAQQVSASAAKTVSNARNLASQTTSLWGQQPAPTPGSAASKVLSDPGPSTESGTSKETSRGVR